jgi:hypothetical protein
MDAPPAIIFQPNEMTEQRSEGGAIVAPKMGMSHSEFQRGDQYTGILSVRLSKRSASFPRVELQGTGFDFSPCNESLTSHKLRNQPTEPSCHSLR